jgi:ribosomal protein L24E
MLELSSHEVVCPVCKRVFFPETAIKREVLCGEELYPHTDKLARLLDCQIHYFCSETCFKRFQNRNRKKISRLGLFLEKLARANSGKGCGGLRCDDIKRI